MVVIAAAAISRSSQRDKICTEGHRVSQQEVSLGSWDGIAFVLAIEWSLQSNLNHQLG